MDIKHPLKEYKERRSLKITEASRVLLAQQAIEATLQAETPARKQLFDTISDVINRSAGVKGVPFVGPFRVQRYITPQREISPRIYVSLSKLQDNEPKLTKNKDLPRRIHFTEVQVSTVNDDGTSKNERYFCQPTPQGLGYNLWLAGEEQDASEGIPVLENDANWIRLSEIIHDFQAADLETPQRS